MHNYFTDKRFEGLHPLTDKAWLASPTPHRETEMAYIRLCYDSGWLTTLGANIDAIEELVGAYMSAGVQKKKAVALVNGTAAIHLAVKLAAEKVYGSAGGNGVLDGKRTGGALCGRRVFVSDMTFVASVNPIVYEGGEPVFIDSEPETWNMDPEALRKAFEQYPDVKIVVYAHLYGVPGKIGQIRQIVQEYGAVLVEDAAESLGTEVGGVPTGAFGDYGAISFNGNKIITGSSGGMLLVPDEYSYNKAKKWSTQSREMVPWYEHVELGYNYRISNLIEGVVRGQWDYLQAHIGAKRAIYQKYVEGLGGLPLSVHGGGNYWLSCALIHPSAMCSDAGLGCKSACSCGNGRTCPAQMLEALETFNCEGRPVWKPMHLQPMYRSNTFVTSSGRVSADDAAGYGKGYDSRGITTDIFNRGICLPSDNKMGAAQQEVVIEVIRRCFQKP